MDSEPAVQWVPVASFVGLYAEVEADLLVAHLRGSDIPVLRIPFSVPISLLYHTQMPGTFPIRVYVPPEHAESATELAAEQEPQSVPQPVRAVAQWLLAQMVLLPVSGAVFGSRERAAHLATSLSAVCGLGLLWRGLQLLAWLRRERPHLVNWGPVIVAALTWAVASVVIGVLTRVLHVRSLDVADSFWQIAVGLSLLVVVVACARLGRK